jgi:hypothetical protein
MTGTSTLKLAGKYMLYLQKTFDSVPHRNLLLFLKQMGLHPTLLNGCAVT